MTRLCVICGVDISHKFAKAKVCGRECQIKRDSKRRRESGSLRKANMSPEKYAKVKAARDRDQAKRKALGKNRTTWTCVVCDKTFTAKRYESSGYWCSPTCQFRYWKAGVEPAKTTELVHKARPIPKAPTIIIRGAWWTAGNCAVCGELFVSQYLEKTCTPECQRKLNRNSNWVSPRIRYRIYERDAWTCHLCDKPVPSNLEWDNETWQPDYPSLDHVIPRSQGGQDTEDNLRLAHFECNWIRGTDPL